MEMKDIIKYVAIAAGIYVVWEYVLAPMMSTTAASVPAPATGTAGTLPAGTTATNSTPVATPQCPAGYTGTYPNCVAPVVHQTPPPPAPVLNNTFQSSDYGTTNWMSRVGNAMLVAAGMNAMQNFDNWAFYYQNQANGSPISGNLMQNIINVGGGDRSAMITAPQFVGYLVQAGTQYGLSGLGDIVYTGTGGLGGLGNFYRLG